METKRDKRDQGKQGNRQTNTNRETDKKRRAWRQRGGQTTTDR